MVSELVPTLTCQVSLPGPLHRVGALGCGLGEMPVAVGFCQHGNGPSDSTKGSSWLVKRLLRSREVLVKLAILLAGVTAVK
jgi:hypothetical protein